MEKAEDLLHDNDKPQTNAASNFAQWCRAHKRVALSVSIMILLLPFLGLLALHESHAQWTSPETHPSRRLQVPNFT